VLGNVDGLTRRLDAQFLATVRRFVSRGLQSNSQRWTAGCEFAVRHELSIPPVSVAVVDIYWAVEFLSGFTSSSLTTSFTLGTLLASIAASFFCAAVFTLPFNTSVPFLAS